MRRLALASAALLGATACAREPAETYGFVATLGNDTTSVERVTRTRDRVVSDAVGRSPVVTRRHWEAELAPDGSVRRWRMDTYVPNAPPDQRELHHTAEFTDRAVELTRQVGKASRSFAYTRRYAVTVPWNAFVYGTYELLFDAARARPDSARIGQYFFEGWDEGHVGYAEVGKRSDSVHTIRSTGLAGTGVARFDRRGRMLSYSGEGTTYKQEVRRLDDVPDIEAIAARFSAAESASGVARSLSPRDTVRASLGATTVTIDYSRPARRGRTLLGGLIPYEQVWRTGANAATQLSVSRPIRLAGIALDSGTYTLWTLPRERDVQLIVNRESGQWGTSYHADRDVARAAMEVDTLAADVERFTIRVDTSSGGTGGSPAQRGSPGARLVMEWGTFRWSAPIAGVAARGSR